MFIAGKGFFLKNKIDYFGAFSIPWVFKGSHIWEITGHLITGVGGPCICKNNAKEQVLRNLEQPSTFWQQQNATAWRAKLQQAFKVREFINDLNTKFQINYNPYHEQAVDEAMIKYKQTFSLKHYMPMKSTKRGIKLWYMAEVPYM